MSIQDPMTFYEELIEGLKKSVSEDFDGKLTRLAKAADTHPTTVTRLLQGDRQKWLNLISRLADSAGLKIVSTRQPAEAQSREVCFVSALTVPAGGNSPPPFSEDYLAVPLVGEAGAGPGIIPQDEILSWVLVYRNLRSVARRSNLIAVEIGKNSRSMVPLLYPGDLVLVDLNDKGETAGFSPPGNIFLVREPGQEGGGKVKRVSVSGQGQNTILNYYSENSAENEPEPYFLHQDFDGEIDRAIVGRIVWAWTDLSRK
ncbi:S24 family peptidase [Desulfovibrio sp. OttesenSCG-928-G15]|nr:S24 family peptidase [Desulfovibrio sp. OttesenSCG-928-G15]